MADFEYLQTERGTKLMTSGWWGRSRHPNYFGDWLMAYVSSFRILRSEYETDEQPSMVSTYRIQHSDHLLLPRILRCPSPT